VCRARERSGVNNRRGRLQTILTCATMPPALRSLAQQLCTKAPLIVDLVGKNKKNQKREGDLDVHHFCTPVVASSRAGVLRLLAIFLFYTPGMLKSVIIRTRTLRILLKNNQLF
jgi:hypothetical protein